MRFTFFSLLVILVVSMGMACKKSVSGLPSDEDNTGNVIVSGSDVLVWVDARANVFQAGGRFNDKNEIKIILDSLKIVGVTGLVVDVKHRTGYTLYQSNYTKTLTSYNGRTLPDNYVGFMVEEAKKRSMKIYLSIQTFVEGDGSTSMGTVYDDAEFRSRNEAIVCDVNGNRVPVTSTGANAFVNPASPEVQERILNIIKEVVGKFDIDGLILDYSRYKDISADFSDLSKAQFIKFLEDKYADNDAKNMNFPQDIVSSWKLSGTAVIPDVTGKYYKKWLYYRASVLKDFVTKAKVAVKTIKPHVALGAYVGAWYNTYYELGVNWASEDYDPFNDQSLKYSWAEPGYKETGYAEEIDLLLTGNYFKQLMLSENPVTADLFYHWWSVEGSLNGISYITKNKVPLYGSLDIGNTAYANEAEISNAMKYILSRTNGGLMLFDVIHVYAPRFNYLKKPLWDALENGLKDN